jgi:DNA-binding CsgD family transcriptional regulator/tetratricopeptide (TPR) repeat protein
VGNTYSGLFEREAELDALSTAVDAVAEGGHGRLLLVEGAAGSGKSALLDAAMARAASRGARTLRGSGGELETEFSFGVALQLLEPALTTAGDADRYRLLRGAAGFAAPLFPTGPAETPTAEDESHRLIHGLFWLITNLADDGPLAVAVDDAQWADRVSLRFLLYLAARLHDLPVLVAVALRPLAPGPNRDLLLQLGTQPRAMVLEPQPLSAGGTCDLVRRRWLPGAQPAFCARLHELTKGNPFLVSEYARAAAGEGHDGSAARAEELDALVPGSVQRSVIGRVSRLGDDATAAAGALAVLGDDATHRRVAVTADLPGPVEAAALDALVAAEIVTPTPEPRFVHPVMREALYHDLPVGVRATFHRRAATALRLDRLAPSRIARHLVDRPPARDDWVVATLWAAGVRALNTGMPTTAVSLLRRALAEPPPDDVRPDLLVDLGIAEAAIADDRAVGHLEDAVALLDSRREKALTLYHIGRTLRSHGRIHDAARAFLQGAETAPAEHEDLTAMLDAALLSVARHDRTLRQLAVPRIDRLESKVEPGANAVQRAALAEVAFELSLDTSVPAERIQKLAHRSIDLDDPLQTAGPENVSVYAAATALARTGDLDAAEVTLTAALEEGRRSGSLMGIATACYRRAMTRYYRGRLVEAADDARLAIEAGAQGWALNLPGAVAYLVFTLTEQGELHQAGLAIERGMPWAEPHENHVVMLLLCARARLQLVLGEPLDALEDLRSIQIVDEESFGGLNPAAVPWRSAMALALDALGRDTAAIEVADEEGRLARRFGAPRPLGAALRVAGVVRGPSEGRDLLLESLAILEPSPARLERAETMVALGTALTATGQKRRGLELLRLGRELAVDCGAVLLDQRAKSAIRAAGGRPRRVAVTGPNSLTPSERRVAEQAANGLSNREIAERLFVTVKAVEWHLRNAFRKLGISSRHELASALAGNLDRTA